MKVSDLINELSNLNEDDEVYFSYKRGDHCQTPVASPVNSIDEMEISYSDYHNMFKVASDDNENNKRCVLIS